MPKHPVEPLLEYWYRALASPYGIEIVCTDINSTKAHLYAVRKEVRDPDLNQVSTTVSPFDPMRLWLIKRRPPPNV